MIDDSHLKCTTFVSLAQLKSKTDQTAKGKLMATASRLDGLIIFYPVWFVFCVSGLLKDIQTRSRTSVACRR